MSFYVACECGRAFEVEDGHSAPTARCPDCGRDVAVAAPERQAEPESVEAVEAVETVEAERAGDRAPEPSHDGPPPGFGPGPRVQFGTPGGPGLRVNGTGCLVLLLLLIAVSIAVPQFGAAVAGALLGCCVLPLLVVGVMFWWRMRQLRKLLDPQNRDPNAGPVGPGGGGTGIPFG